MYPAQFIEITSKTSGTRYRVFLRDAPEISGGQNELFVDAVNTLIDAVERHLTSGQELPPPSAPHNGDIMIEVKL